MEHGRERIAVVGAGLMGHGIAQVFAAAGHSVAITDENPFALETVPERVRRNLEQMSQDAAAADAIDLVDELDRAVSTADVVFEAAPEDAGIKRALFARISRVGNKHALLATNTSVISIGEIAKDADDPGRVVGTHWWNPPYLIPLVEVTQADTTRPDTVARMIKLLARVGKSPIHVRKDIPGFVGNRLQHALWREAIALIDTGVCDAESIDRVVKESFGLRLSVLGPIENADLVGLDLTLAIHEYLLPHLDRSLGPASILREHVACGDLGMKTGRGFRSWSEKEARTVRERLLAHLLAVNQGRCAPHRAPSSFRTPKGAK